MEKADADSYLREKDPEKWENDQKNIQKKKEEVEKYVIEQTKRNNERWEKENGMPYTTENILLITQKRIEEDKKRKKMNKKKKNKSHSAGRSTKFLFYLY